MLFRKPDVKVHKYYLKSIHFLWLVPALIINIVVPLLNYYLFKINNNDMKIDIEKNIFFFFPLFSVWTSGFVTEMFFSEKTKDVFFILNNKKRLIISIKYYLFFLINIIIITLLHFYCIDAFFSLTIKILSVSLFYFGLEMFVLSLSKSATATIMILLLYDLTNTLININDFFVLYENYDKINFKIFLTDYFPLIISASILTFIAFNRHKTSK